MFSVANLPPGRGFQPFTVHSKSSELTDSGRVVSGYKETEVWILAVLTSAKQSEIEQWKQNGHPISHKIIQYGAIAKAKATDYLVAANGRRFYVQGVKNQADLNISMTYYVEERFDIK